MPSITKKKWKKGQRVMITGNHPWAGNTGTIASIDKTLIGTGAKIDMDNSSSCYCHRDEHMEKIK